MFQLQKVNNGQFYFDLAYRNAQSSTCLKKFKIDNKREKAKKTACYWISMFARSAKGLMSSISSGFPLPEKLPEFYSELIKAVINTKQLEYSLNAIIWTGKKISEMESKHCSLIKKEITLNGIEKQKKAFLGRAGSLFKRIDKHLGFLEECRLKLRNFPSIKTGIPTICICGFPNVGKSTLLSKITTAKPEIAPYAFTTKSLMLGYIGNELQIIDTPGNFKEIFGKMNWIEKQSYLAIKYLAISVIYVFDITETCGFLVKDQFELYEKLKKGFPDKQFIIYLSKNDMLEKKKIDEFAAEHGFSELFYDEKQLKNTLLERYKNI